MRNILFFALLVLINFFFTSAILNVTILVYGIGIQSLIQSLPYTAPGFDLGVRDARIKYNSTFNLSHVYVSDNSTKGCDDTGAYFDQVSNYVYKNRQQSTLTVLFYPGCDGSTILAQLGREWNMFVLSSGTTFSNLRDRSLYPSTIALGPLQYEIYGAFVKKLLETYRWASAVFIYDTSGQVPFNRIVFLRIQNYLRRFAKDLRLYPLEIDFHIGEEKIPYKQIISQLSKLSRIVFISLPHPTTRNFLITAYEEGWKTGAIVWISVDVPQGTRGNLTWKLAGYSAQEAITLKAFRSVFKLEPCTDLYPTVSDQLFTELRNRSMQVYNVTFPLTMQGPNEYVTTAYNAVLMFAQVVSEILLDNTETPFEGSFIASRFLNRTFYLNSGDNIYIDLFGERQNRMCLMDFDLPGKKFETVQYFDGKDNLLHDVSDRTIDWGTPDNKPPMNEPDCNFRPDLSICSSQGLTITTVTTVTLIVTLLILASAGILFRNFNKSRPTVDEDWWIIGEGHLQRMIGSTNVSYESHYHRRNVATRRMGLRKCLCVSSGQYNGEVVCLKSVLVTGHPNLFPNQHASKLLKELDILARRSSNICKLIGVFTESTQITFVSEWCQKGSLVELQESNWIDWDLQCFFITDILQALFAIHNSPLKRHGHLRLSTCLVDKQLTIKIGDTGLYDLIGTAHVRTVRLPRSDPREWVAPELRSVWMNSGNVLAVVAKAEAPADVYSFSTILAFLIANYGKGLTNSGSSENHIIAAQIFLNLSSVIRHCQTTAPANRPTISYIKTKLGDILGNSQNGSLVDRLLQRLEVYSIQLETAISNRTTELLNERSVCDQLLKEMLPKEVILQLRSGVPVEPQIFESISIFFSYLVGFSEFLQAHQENPLCIVDFLNDVFVIFDDIVERFDLYKLETIADTYMVAGGLASSENGSFTQGHVPQVCFMAQAFASSFCTMTSKGDMEIQIGIHVGPCVGGVVGFKRPRYCLFGDTVNTASRLASQSEPSKIQICESTALIIMDKPEFRITRRGIVCLKGKGDFMTYWLIS